MSNKITTYTAEGEQAKPAAVVPKIPVIPSGRVMTADEKSQLFGVQFVEVVQPDGSVKRFAGGYHVSKIIDALKRRGNA